MSVEELEFDEIIEMSALEEEYGVPCHFVSDEDAS